jgi:hypothetical protein
VKDESSDYVNQIANMFLHLRRKKIDAMIENHLTLIKEEGNDGETFELMMEFLTELNELKRQIAQKLGNSVSRI